MMDSFPRRLLLSGFAALGVLGMSACAQERIERVLPSAGISSQPALNTLVPGSHPRKWAHFGDSFTASGYLAQELEGLTGYSHISAGVAGDIAKFGAFRAGALELEVGLEDNVLPASEPALIERTSIEPNPIAANGWDYPCAIAGVPGYLKRKVGEQEAYFYRESPGAEVPVEEWNSVEIDPVQPTDILTEGIKGQYSLIVGFGRNELDTGIDVEETVKYITDILNTNTAVGVRHLVWDVPPWSYEPLGSDKRVALVDFNSRLSDAFGDMFIRPIQMMLDNPDETFTEARVFMTDQDRVDLDKGVIPESLRLDEWGHLNEAGARAWAHYVYQEIRRRGW